MAINKAHWLALVNIVMNLWVPQNIDNFLKSRVNITSYEKLCYGSQVNPNTVRGTWIQASLSAEEVTKTLVIRDGVTVPECRDRLVERAGTDESALLFFSFPKRMVRNSLQGAQRSTVQFHVLQQQQEKTRNIRISSEFRVCVICTTAKPVPGWNEVR